MPSPVSLIPFRTHHALIGLSGSLDGGTFWGVSVAEAVSSDHHVIDGVVVLLFDLYARVQQVVAKRVKFGELNPQVGDLQQVWPGKKNKKTKNNKQSVTD